LTVIGVDIGNRGAIALIDESGELVDISDMPCLADGPKGRPTVHAPLLAAIVAKSGAARAYVEWVGPRPTDGSVGAFAFGYAKGASEGVLAAGGVPVTFLTPPKLETARRHRAGQGRGERRGQERGDPPLARQGGAVQPRPRQWKGRSGVDRHCRRHEGSKGGTDTHEQPENSARARVCAAVLQPKPICGTRVRAKPGLGRRRGG
jgi:hypothetical protein